MKKLSNPQVSRHYGVVLCYIVAFSVLTRKSGKLSSYRCGHVGSVALEELRESLSISIPPEAIGQALGPACVFFQRRQWMRHFSVR